jgi:plasmid stability protein
LATLYLRNVPSDLDAALTADARANGVSKNRRAIEALRRGLGLDKVKRSELVAQIKRHRPSVTADVAKLIREERPGQDI